MHKCVVSVWSDVWSQCVVTGCGQVCGYRKVLHVVPLVPPSYLFKSHAQPLSYTHSFVSVYFALETVSFTGLQLAKWVILTATAGTRASVFLGLRLRACTFLPGFFLLTPMSSGDHIHILVLAR